MWGHNPYYAAFQGIRCTDESPGFLTSVWNNLPSFNFLSLVTTCSKDSIIFETLAGLSNSKVSNLES